MSSNETPLPFLIVPAEWDRLSREPSEVFLLYCYFRMYMDYETGITGLKRRFNDQGIRELLGVDSIQGRAAVKLKRQEHRPYLRRLISMGFLEPKTDLGPLVFFMPVAYRDKSVQKKLPQCYRNDVHEVVHDSDDDFFNENKADTSMRDYELYAKMEQGCSDVVRTSEVVDINNTHNARARVDGVRQQSHITADWRPSDHVAVRLRMRGIDEWTEDDLQIFISKKMSRGFPSANWDEEFIAWQVKAKLYKDQDEARGQKHGQQSGNQTGAVAQGGNGAGRSQSVMAQVRAANKRTGSARAIDVQCERVDDHGG